MTQSILLLFPSFCCFFWIIIFLCRWKQIQQPVKVGTLALVFVGISSLIRGLSLTELSTESSYHLWEILEVFCLLNFYSCMILLVRTLVGKSRPTEKDYRLFLPGGVIAVFLLSLYFLIGKENMATFPREQLQPFMLDKIGPDPLYRIYYIVYIYVYRIALILVANVTLIYAWSSFVRRAPLFFLSAALLFSLFLLGWEQLIRLAFFVFIVGWILWGCALFYLGYWLSLIDAPASRSANDEVEDPGLPAKGEDTEAWQRVREKLLPLFHRLMDEEHLFLQHNLRMDDLVRRAQTNRNYIFLLLKEEYGYGFSEYINRRRIEYAQQLVRANLDLTQEQLAEKCGFSHASAFSRAFRTYTGITFKEWVKEQR